jgi:DNA repair protein RecN (Recombination protein N)
MLTSLFIRNFAIVPQLDLVLEPGLTVLTGETGAGKSILVDALMLALGARTDADNIRDGADSAEVNAGFELHPEEDAAIWLQEHELYEEDGCVLRRLVYRNKPTKAFINGRPVTLQLLRDFSQRIIDIHGQYEHQSLLRIETQRQIVDDFASQGKNVENLATLYEQLKQLQSQLDNLNSESSTRLHEIDLLRFQTTELEQMRLQDGEFLQLEQEHAKLAHANELREGIEFCYQHLYDAEQYAVATTITQCLNELNGLLDYEPKLSQIIDLMSQASIHIDEATTQLRQLSSGIELDPRRLDEVERRMSALLNLARKHQCEPDKLTHIHQKLANKLTALEHTDTSIEGLHKSLRDTQEHYEKTADKLSKQRRISATNLSKLITEQMQELGMKGGRCEVTLAERDRAVPTRFGFDDIIFQVSTNRSQPLRPLKKVASGGELSRISLAIQVITGRVGRVPTLIFDEVDVGIGGGVAEIVGQRLRSLAQKRQVICITHLPQVAAQGDNHHQVKKYDDNGVRVTIIPLTDDERVQEIARMLGGVKITDQTMAHAHDMLSRTTHRAEPPSLSVVE